MFKTQLSYDQVFLMNAARGMIPGVTVINKFGRNLDIDTGSTPEDVWNGGGTYTGFPDGAETVTVTSSSSADSSSGTGARTIRVTGLDSNWNEASETLTLNGVTGVTSTTVFRRIHTARVLSAGSGGVNAGEISCTHSTTTENKFFQMPTGDNQTKVAAYTVPAGKTALVISTFCSIRGASAAQANGNLWIRNFGEVFRSRRSFSVNTGADFNLWINGGLVLPEKSDITARITSVSANNTDIVFGFDVVLFDNDV